MSGTSTDPNTLSFEVSSSDKPSSGGNVIRARAAPTVGASSSADRSGTNASGARSGAIEDRSSVPRRSYNDSPRRDTAINLPPMLKARRRSGSNSNRSSAMSSATAAVEIAKVKEREQRLLTELMTAQQALHHFAERGEKWRVAGLKEEEQKTELNAQLRGAEAGAEAQANRATAEIHHYQNEAWQQYQRADERAYQTAIIGSSALDRLAVAAAVVHRSEEYVTAYAEQLEDAEQRNRVVDQEFPVAFRAFQSEKLAAETASEEWKVYRIRCAQLEEFAMGRNVDCEKSEEIASQLHNKLYELGEESSLMNSRWRADWGGAEVRVQQSAEVMEGSLQARSAKIVLLEGIVHQENTIANGHLKRAESSEEAYRQDVGAHSGANGFGGPFSQADIDRLQDGFTEQINQLILTIDESRKDYASMKEDLIEAQSHTDEYESEIAGLQEQVHQLTHEMKIMRDEITKGAGVPAPPLADAIARGYPSFRSPLEASPPVDKIASMLASTNAIIRSKVLAPKSASGNIFGAPFRQPTDDDQNFDIGSVAGRSTGQSNADTNRPLHERFRPKEFKAPAIPHVTGMAKYKIAMARNLVSSSVYDDKAEVLWISECETKGFEELEKHGEDRFGALDCLMAPALVDKCKGDLKTMIEDKELEAIARGTVLSGRQIYYLILWFFKTDGNMGTVYSITDLTDLKWLGDENMSDYRSRLKHTIDNFEDETWKSSEIGKKQLRNILAKHITTGKSKALEADLAHFNRQRTKGEGTEDYTFDYLWTSMNRYIDDQREQKLLADRRSGLTGKQPLAPVKGDGKGKAPKKDDKPILSAEELAKICYWHQTQHHTKTCLKGKPDCVLEHKLVNKANFDKMKKPPSKTGTGKKNERSKSTDSAGKKAWSSVCAVRGKRKAFAREVMVASFSMVLLRSLRQRLPRKRIRRKSDQPFTVPTLVRRMVGAVPTLVRPAMP